MLSKIKMDFFKDLLEWFRNNGSFDQMENIFLTLVKKLHISMEDLEHSMATKEKARGGFRNNILLRYVLINAKSHLVEKFLLGANNIFDGIVMQDGKKYYKFISEKAIRDSVVCLCQQEYACVHRKETVNDDEFCRLLGNKLFEECKEILHAKNAKDLLEEMGDFYTVLRELQHRQR